MYNLIFYFSLKRKGEHTKKRGNRSDSQDYKVTKLFSDGCF